MVEDKDTGENQSPLRLCVINQQKLKNGEEAQFAGAYKRYCAAHCILYSWDG
jgi:hypothetical protein